MKQNGIKFDAYDIVFIFIVLYVLFIKIVVSDYIADDKFLYNRAYNLYTCLKDGVYPYLYYNDFHGVGYGSSFFYGQWTLLPFLVFIKNEEIFLNVYYLTVLLLNYFGLSKFASKFTVNNKLVAILYIMSPFYLENPLECNKFAVGLSWFFLYYCIEFFRDNRSFYKASICYILILNTHFITSIMSFLVCVCIMFYYFDKSRLVNYIKFASLTSAMSLYNIINMLYHSDTLSLVKIFEVMNEDGIVVFTFNLVPFISEVVKKLLDILDILPAIGTQLTCCTVFLFCLFCFYKQYKTNGYTRKNIVILEICLLSFIIGIRPIWVFIADAINPFFQFPCRFVFYTLAIALIITLRRIKVRKRTIAFVFSICLIDIIIGQTGAHQAGADVIENKKMDYIVQNGEYLSDNFVWVLDEFEELSSKPIIVEHPDIELSHKVDKNKFIVDVPEHDEKITIRIPKLWYKGYVTSKNDIKCHEGYSQFVEIDIDDYVGSLSVYYKQPVVLLIFQSICILSTLFCIYNIILSYRRMK